MLNKCLENLFSLLKLFYGDNYCIKREGIAIIPDIYNTAVHPVVSCLLRYEETTFRTLVVLRVFLAFVLHIRWSRGSEMMTGLWQVRLVTATIVRREKS